MMRIIIFLVLLLFISSPIMAKDCHYKVGVVPQFEQRKLLEIWSPILNNLKQETGCKFELVGNTSIIEFEKNFTKGTFDVAYMNPYHAVMAKKSQGYEPILRSGVKKLKGILVVPKDSAIKTVQELDGKQVAFPSPNALGASLLMRAELETQHNTSVDPVYVKTHSSVYLHVAKGLTDAGGGVSRTLQQQPDNIKGSLRVLYTTTPVYAHPIVVHPRINTDLKNAIQKTLLNHSDLLKTVPMIDPTTTNYDDYKELENFGLENFVGNKD